MKKDTKSQLPAYIERINRECFWEFSISNSRIIKMAQEGSSQEKQFLYAKIMENASDIFQSLSIFSISDQKDLTLRYRVPKFNHNFLEKRHKITTYFVTGQQVDIPELRWNI